MLVLLVIGTIHGIDDVLGHEVKTVRGVELEPVNSRVLNVSSK